MQAGLGDMQLGRNVGVAEPVESTQLHQPLRDIEDAGSCIAVVDLLVVLRTLSSVQCHRDILSHIGY
jgi:hypothetical protein